MNQCLLPCRPPCLAGRVPSGLSTKNAWVLGPPCPLASPFSFGTGRKSRSDPFPSLSPPMLLPPPPLDSMNQTEIDRERIHKCISRGNYDGPQQMDAWEGGRLGGAGWLAILLSRYTPFAHLRDTWQTMLRTETRPDTTYVAACSSAQTCLENRIEKENTRCNDCSPTGFELRSTSYFFA